MEVFNVAIVGGGPACSAMIRLIAADQQRQLRMNLVGVADIHPDAPGIKLAQALKIYTTTDFHDLFALKDLNLILELTGRPEISEAIKKEKPDHVQFVDHVVARLFWDFIRVEEEMVPKKELEKRIKAVSKLFWDLIQLEQDRLLAERKAKEQINAVNVLLKDVISLEEEKLAAEREVEKRVRAERDYTSKILNSLPQAVIVLNQDYIIENANETFLKEFVSGGEEVIGRPCFEVLFNRKDIRDVDFCPIMELTSDPLRMEHKEFTIERDGDLLYYEAHCSPLRDERGDYNRFLLSISNITHRKKLELDLEKSQKRYRKLFQDARDGIILFNKEGKILEANVSLYHMLGFSRNELENMHVADLVEKISKKILSDHLEELEIMGFVPVELDFVKKNGDSLPVEASIIYLPEEGMFQAMVRDISTRKKLEESRKLYSERLEKEVKERTKELQASQQETLKQKKYAEGIIYGSPIAMFVLDRDHKITYWNKACEKLTGYSGTEMIGTDNHWMPFYPHKRPLLADLVIKNDIETIHKLYDDMNLRKSQMVEGAYEAEHYFPHLGKEGTHLYFNAAPIRGDSGVIQGAIVTYQDFSERVKMTQEIRRREAFVRNLIQNSIDGIIATDEKGKIVIFNQGAVDILGYSPDVIIGQMSYTEILSRETMKKIRSGFYHSEYGPEGKIINMEVELLNKDGEPIPVRLSGTLLYEKKKEVGSVVFIQDLREILRLQKEKEQAERMAAIGQTVAGLAHYIKNILNGLKGGAYVINSAMRKENLELVEKGWRMVEKNIDQITHIVMDMLIYSRERKPEYKMEDPNELVMDVLELMEEKARVSNVTLVHELKHGLKEVSMDRTAIHRCLLNLVSNAIDACTLEGIIGGKGIVTVRTDRPEGWAVRFEVIDNGTGMDEETQRKLFTSFFSTKGYKGTGLGLPVTQKIVKEHNGELSFKSQLGVGTTFTLLLPERGTNE